MRSLLGLLGVCCVIGVTAGRPAYAKGSEGETLFPATISEQVIRELLAVGRVDPKRAPTPANDPDAWKRWGCADLDHQESAMRAVVDALQGSRPPLSVAASILAIARVESGWNPYSENPTSTACGIFQFVKATWSVYSDTREACFDPSTNARAGVKHLTSIWSDRVHDAIAPLTLITTETERVEWTYRLLYAYHYHGEASPAAPGGGSLVAQSAAETGLEPLRSFFTILKKATYVPPTRMVKQVAPKSQARARRRRA